MPFQQLPYPLILFLTSLLKTLLKALLNALLDTFLDTLLKTLLNTLPKTLLSRLLSYLSLFRLSDGLCALEHFSHPVKQKCQRNYE